MNMQTIKNLMNERVLVIDDNVIDIPQAKGVGKVVVVMHKEGDYSKLWRVAQLNKNTYFAINDVETFFDQNEHYNELEQFMRNKLKAELDFTKVMEWFQKNSFQYGDTTNYIFNVLNTIRNKHLNLYNEYCNMCTAVGYSPKQFKIYDTDIDSFNTRVANTHDSKKNQAGYAGNDGIRRYYNIRNEYCEEPETYRERTAFKETESSYKAKCRSSYNIASPVDVINVIALSFYLDKEDIIAPDTYKCECGQYNRYRTTQVEYDFNRGCWKSYPDVDVCCPCCGQVKRKKD